MKERIKGAFTKKKIFQFLKMALFVVALSLILLSLLGTVAHATGLVDDTINAKNLYSKYPLSNYQLDFYVDNSWSWLPWNWLDGIGKSVQYGLYCITNFVWTISLYLSNATGYVVQEAYKLDFINDMADSIGQSIQTLAGVTENGFSSTGFYIGFLLLIILVVGIYVAYTGLIKRETSKALHAVINFVVVFILSASFIAYAPDYIKKINEFSSDISTASLDLGTKIMLPNSDSEGKDSVDLIRDSLFSIQVEQPWLLLQFGNSNAEEIGTDRVEALVSASPEDEDGKTREEVVKTEIEDNDNNNLTIPQVVNRLGMVFFLLFFNLGITIFVFLLTGMMLFSQILFIIFAMFLPISFLLSMIPSYESMAKQAIVRVFNTIMTRAGITLIVTVAFSISSMFYNISTDYPFFMVAFLQIVCFAGIYMKLGDLMSMFSLNAGDSQSMGRRIFRRPYLFMRHRARRMEHRIARAVSAGGISGGVAGAVAGSAVAGKRAERKNTASKENRGNTTSSMGQRAGSKVGAVLDTKNKVKDKANAVKENIKDMPTQTAYAVYSAKEKAKSSVSDFKRGMVQEQQSRQTGRLEKQEQRRQNIADKRMELQKAQEARQAQRKADGSATTGATRPHERPATASTIPKPSAEKMQEVKRPATATTSKASEPVKTNVIKERPLSSGASDKKTTQPAQPVHRQNVEKVVSKETRQNYKAERTTKTQTFEQSKRTTEHTEKNRNLVTKKGQKKK
ncbi:YtxH domain-containing protein [Blautia wexlerae]|uniref:CD3337/EF1877 family mobilome membrane protein n=1 Tax=Blautia wexlerae TaxID=418240 RepID=UPI001D070A31|nr:YtxH domain-containing protein [Blautia wexlerae]MCB6690018.1 YtxH domain-containing protein [Blautia wexlerae]